MNCHRHSVEEVDLEETSSVHYYNTHLDMFYLIVNETVDCPPSTETTFREKKMEAAVSVFWSYFFASWSTRKVMMSSRSLSHPSPPPSPPDECNVLVGFYSPRLSPPSNLSASIRRSCCVDNLLTLGDY